MSLQDYEKFYDRFVPHSLIATAIIVIIFGIIAFICHLVQILQQHFAV